MATVFACEDEQSKLINKHKNLYNNTLRITLDDASCKDKTGLSDLKIQKHSYTDQESKLTLMSVKEI